MKTLSKSLLVAFLMTLTSVSVTKADVYMSFVHPKKPVTFQRGMYTTATSIRCGYTQTDFIHPERMAPQAVGLLIYPGEAIPIANPFVPCSLNPFTAHETTCLPSPPIATPIIKPINRLFLSDALAAGFGKSVGSG